MYLYLIRHAKSDRTAPYLDDFDRPLNGRGRRNAPFMGKLLKELGISFDLILSSPAVRCEQTIREMADQIDYEYDNIIFNPRIYESGTATLTEIIQSLPPGTERIALCGHNDELTLTANLLASAFVTENIPTAGIVGLRFETSEPQNIRPGTGTCILYEFPKKYETLY